MRLSSKVPGAWGLREALRNLTEIIYPLTPVATYQSGHQHGDTPASWDTGVSGPWTSGEALQAQLWSLSGWLLWGLYSNCCSLPPRDLKQGQYKNQS